MRIQWIGEASPRFDTQISIGVRILLFFPPMHVLFFGTRAMLRLTEKALLPIHPTLDNFNFFTVRINLHKVRGPHEVEGYVGRKFDRSGRKRLTITLNTLRF